ncbi:MAG: RNA-directed DNA polymerase, partial [Candidatus Aenigmatarchaeota archaeon]
MDKLYNKFSKIENLKLAWTRIKTSQNIFYKNYYRELFIAYELSLDENLKNLRQRLIGKSYKPQEILRFYIPKSTGLHRSITFLYLDDLIVYQAMGNIIAEKFRNKRQEVEHICVFSNIFNNNKDKKIFLFEKWQEGYKKFIKKIKDYYKKGNLWVAHFDLAAYYDTISHEVISKQIARDTNNNFIFFLKECLKTWTTNKTEKVSHGIPQGPITSSLIGEIYLLPIDLELKKKNIKYVRYVDDIKIFGKSREECLEGVILLEKECKERGLIPQSKKFGIIKADKVEDAIGKFPSITLQEKKYFFSDTKETARIFKEAFNEEKFDASKIRYILKISRKNKKILNIVINNLRTHPELVDEFYQFLLNYEDQNTGEKIFKSILNKPFEYEYVEGKYWTLISYFNFNKKKKDKLINFAIERLKSANKKPEKPALRLGIYRFLSSRGDEFILKSLKKEKSVLIQSFVIPHFNPTCFSQEPFIKFVNNLIEHSISYEPALVYIKQLIFNYRTDILSKLRKPVKDQSNVLNNTLGWKTSIDTIGEILSRVVDKSLKNFGWKKFLGKKEYTHANYIISLAEKNYHLDKNAWVNYMDSFNDIVVRKFIEYLRTKEPKTNWPKTVDSKGNVVDFGKMLDKNNVLSKKFPKIADNFREFHKRRSKTPLSHAFDKKTGKPSIIVTYKEQKKLINSIREGYIQLTQTIQNFESR